MSDFLASLGPFGWTVLALAVLGVVTLPRALTEYWGLRGPSARFWRGLTRGPGGTDDR